jgi:drug/metabolite transporter (DMT)-like permease
MTKYLPLIYVLLFTLFWSLQIFVSKLGFLAGLRLLPFLFQSSLLVFLLLGGYICLTKFKQLRKVPKRVSIRLFWASALHAGLGGLLSTVAILYTTAINVAFLFQFTTVTTAVLAWLILKEKMTKGTIVLVMIGIFLFITSGKLITPHIGDLFALGACIAWSLGNVLIRGVLKENPVDADVSTFFRGVGNLSVAVILIVLVPFYPLVFKSIAQTNLFSLNLFPYIFLNALFVSLLCIFLNRALKVASASYMTIMSSLSPIIVAVLAFAFLHETLNTVQLFGAGFIVFGGIITQYLKIDKH